MTIYRKKVNNKTPEKKNKGTSPLFLRWINRGKGVCLSTGTSNATAKNSVQGVLKNPRKKKKVEHKKSQG